MFIDVIDDDNNFIPVLCLFTGQLQSKHGTDKRRETSDTKKQTAEKIRAVYLIPATQIKVVIKRRERENVYTNLH